MFDCVIIICYQIFVLFFLMKMNFFQFNFVENKKYFFTFVALR